MPQRQVFAGRTSEHGFSGVRLQPLDWTYQELPRRFPWRRRATFARNRSLSPNSPIWCSVVHGDEIAVMKNRKRVGKNAKNPAATVRASISFPSHVYRSLETLARQNKVSLAWVVRDAAEKYVAVKTAAPASSTAS